MLLNTQIEELSCDMKQEGLKDIMSRSEDIMTKKGIIGFISSTVDEIMSEVQKNIEMSTDIKVNVKTVKMNKETNKINKEIELLRGGNNKMKNDLNDVQGRSDKAKEK